VKSVRHFFEHHAAGAQQGSPTTVPGDIHFRNPIHQWELTRCALDVRDPSAVTRELFYFYFNGNDQPATATKRCVASPVHQHLPPTLRRAARRNSPEHQLNRLIRQMERPGKTVTITDAA